MSLEDRSHSVPQGKRALLHDASAALGIVFVASVFWPFLLYAIERTWDGGSAGSIKWDAVVQIGFLTPAWEEMVFRAVPLSLATRRFPGSWRARRVAMIVATVGFALAHVGSHGLGLHLLAQAAVGYALARLYLAHERDAPHVAYAACVAVHGVFLIGRIAMIGPFGALGP